MPNTKNSPKKESSELLIIKFLGWGLILSIIISALAMMTGHTEQSQVWTHIVTFMAGGLAGIVGARVHPIGK